MRLLRLLRWRDAQARSSDKPRSWILDNELATNLARTPPADRAQLQAQLEAHPKAPRKLGDAIWQALSTPLADELQAPRARNASSDDKNALKRLQDAVSARSAELGLARRHPGLAPLSGSAAGNRKLARALSGWRRTELEPLLSPLLGPPREAAG